MSNTLTRTSSIQTPPRFCDTEKIKKGVYCIAVTLVALGVIFSALVLIAQKYALNWGPFNPVIESLGNYAFVPLVTSGGLLVVLIAGGIIWKKCSAERTEPSPPVEEHILRFEARVNHIEFIRKALAQGDLSKSTKSNLLFEATNMGHRDLVYLLLDNGAEPKNLEINNLTSLELIIYSQECQDPQVSLEIMTALLKKDPTLVHTQRPNGQTPLHSAVGARWAAKEKVTLLIAQGANINARDREGCTPLLLMTKSDVPPCLDVIEILMKNRAQLTNDFNRNTFQNLVKEKHSDWLKIEGIQERLKKCGIDMNT